MPQRSRIRRLRVRRVETCQLNFRRNTQVTCRNCIFPRPTPLRRVYGTPSRSGFGYFGQLRLHLLSAAADPHGHSRERKHYAKGKPGTCVEEHGAAATMFGHNCATNCATTYPFCLMPVRLLGPSPSVSGMTAPLGYVSMLYPSQTVPDQNY